MSSPETRVPDSIEGTASRIAELTGLLNLWTAHPAAAVEPASVAAWYAEREAIAERLQATPAKAAAEAAAKAATVLVLMPAPEDDDAHWAAARELAASTCRDVARMFGSEG